MLFRSNAYKNVQSQYQEGSQELKGQDLGTEWDQNKKLRMWELLTNCHEEETR